MAGLFRVDIDNGPLFAAMDAAVLEIEQRLLAAAEVTATRIADEARARVRRRSGETARGITVAPAEKGSGYVVFVRRPDQPGLPGWIEFGTKSMSKREFFFASARLEESGHQRRAEDAVEEALAATGLGG